MMHDYTTTKIIQYIYRELPLTDHLETEYAVATIPEWNQSYTSLKKALAVLPKVQFFPSRKAIESILEYSTEQ